MVSKTAPEAAANNEAVAKTTPSSRKRKGGGSVARNRRPNKRQAATSGRMTRSMFKRMNENSLTPESLNPGLEINPRHRRAPGGGRRRATAATTRPQDITVEASEILGKPENGSAHQSQAHNTVSEAGVAAASRLAQAALKAGLATGISTGGAPVLEHLAGQDLGDDITGAVDDAEATQEDTHPTQPDAPSPLPSTHGSGIDEDAVADAEVDSQEKPKRQRPTPWLPDKADNFKPHFEWPALEQAQSQTKAPVSGDDKPIGIPKPSLIRSGGVGGEAESPVQSHNPGGLDLAPPWQPQANRERYFAGVAQTISPGGNQALVAPLPPAASQWESDNRSVGGREYSPEVFQGDLDEGDFEDGELEEWNDDVGS